MGARETKGKEGKGREREGKGRERKGKDGKGWERKGKEWSGRLRTAWVQESGWKWGEKKPLVMSELGCADGCGREMGAEKCADGCGWRDCNGVAGNGWGKEAAGDERAWLRGRCGRQMGAENCVDGVGATEWLEIGGEKKALVMGDLGCAGGCGRHMGAENCADGCGWRECNGGAGNGSGEEASGDERAWLRGQLRLRTGKIGAENCADGCGRRGSKGWLGMGGGKKPLVMSDLGCADGCGRQVDAENRVAWTAADGVVQRSS